MIKYTSVLIFFVGMDMAELRFYKVTKDVENIKFDCGIKSINEYIQQSYYPLIIQQAYTYSVQSGDKVVGFYQIMFREIELNDFPDEISDFSDSGIDENKIVAVHIRFIAVDNNLHHHKLGTNILRIVIESIKKLSKEWPIRVVTIDAREELIGWYEQEGFKKMKNNTPGQDGVSEAMYFSLLNYSDELEECCSEY